MDTSCENSQDSIELEQMHVLNSFTADSVNDLRGIHNGYQTLNGDLSENGELQPFVVISEQPQQRGFRFRYECEGPSHGGLQGEKTERGKKTHPSIKVENYGGPARIIVTLVTDESPPRAHAHKLVGKNCSDGICTVDVNSCATNISFPNLCILHVTRKKASEVLMNRIVESIKLEKKMKVKNMNVDPGITAEESMAARKQSQEQARNMSLNVVRLCFQVFLPDNNNQYSYMLPQVVSQPIYDSKSPGASALKICRMDKYGGCCTGNEEVFLLCEKVQKEDIQVRFVEHNEDGSVKWEAYGNFSPLDVHRQYAIVFKTPAYYNANIDKAVNVMIMLQRKTDCEVSEAKAFTYYPQNKDKDLIARKKRKKLPLDSSFNYYSGGDGGPGGGAPGGGGMGPNDYGGPGNMDRRYGGGNGGSNSYSVLLPNGSIVDQLGILPATVEQAVKEEFGRHADSPDHTSTEDSNSNQSFLIDPMLWTGSLAGDLEVDAAPYSLRHSLQFSHQSPKILSSVPSKPVGDSSFGHYILPQKCKVIDPKKHEGIDSDQGNSSSPDDVDILKGSISQEKRVNKVGFKMEDKVITDNVISSVTFSKEEAMQNQPDSEVIPETIKTIAVGVIVNSENEKSHAEDVVSRQTTSLDIAMSPTRSDAQASEGFRTDEGFSEVSEEISVKSEPLQKNEQVQEMIGNESKTIPAHPSGSSKPIKAATAVVKRIMERITARTIRALQDYSETGDVRYLLIVQRHLTAIKNENGDLPIHLAVINNQMLSLQQLLDVMTTLPNARATINSFNYMRQTALHLAAIMQQPTVIEMLLHAGSDPSLADRNGNTPAHLAVLNNSLDALKALIRYLRPGVTSVKPFPELDYLNYDGYTPVHLAVHSGNVDMLKLLVHGRANVDMPDGKSGRTALHHAVELDDLPAAGYLLMEANADVNARCFDGNTPLHIACGRGLVGMVALLMTAGANPEIENEEVPPEDIQQQDWEREEEDGPRPCRRGLQPIDYAVGNERILRMLKGDQYISEDQSPVMPLDKDLDEDSENTIKSTCDSGLCSIIVSPGDMEQLAYSTRMELSRLLDPVYSGKDVFTLASRLGFENLVTALEVMGCSGTSPTRFLLDYHETADGTVSKLKECLSIMGREDAVQLIERASKDNSVSKQKQHVHHSLMTADVLGCH